MPSSSALLTGFEPAVSTVTGWRVNRLLHKSVCPVVQRTRWGSNPHRQRGKLVGCRYLTSACVPPVPPRSPRQESNLRDRLTKAASSRYITGAIVSSPGIEPGPRPPQSRVRPPHSEDRQYPDQESNLGHDLRRVACIRYTIRAVRAPGGNRTHLSTLARWRDRRSTTGASVNQQGR